MRRLRRKRHDKNNRQKNDAFKSIEDLRIVLPDGDGSTSLRARRVGRRAVARSGRRATDLRQPVICDKCEGQDVHGWVRTGETLWARCRTCGRVQRVDDDR